MTPAATQESQNMKAVRSFILMDDRRSINRYGVMVYSEGCGIEKAYREDGS